MTEEPYMMDDALSEAAAARHDVPNDRKPRGRPKYQQKPDDVTLHVRLDQKTFNELLKIADKADHGIEGYTRRLLKKDVKDARRAAAIAFLIERHAEIAELLECQDEEE
jgi:hypothetical protein